MKGIVMETCGNMAAVLLKDGTFRNIRGSYRVGEQIEYRKKTFPSIRRWAAAAAVTALLGTGGLWYDANLTAYGEVSLDAVPSIIYTVNRQSRVLSVRAGNESGLAAVEALTQDGVRFMPISEAVEKTIGLLSSEGYMDAEQDDYLLVNISADGEDMQSSLTKAVEEGIAGASADDPTMEIRIDHSDRDTARRAAENSMSTGRYAAWEQAGDGSALETYHEKPVQEIMSIAPEDVPPEEPLSPENGADPEPMHAEPPADVHSEGVRQETMSPPESSMPSPQPGASGTSLQPARDSTDAASSPPESIPAQEMSQKDAQKDMTPPDAGTSSLQAGASALPLQPAREAGSTESAPPDHETADEVSQNGKTPPDAGISAQPAQDTGTLPDSPQDQAVTKEPSEAETQALGTARQTIPDPAAQAAPPEMSAPNDAGSASSPDNVSIPVPDPVENSQSLPESGNRNAPAMGQGAFQPGAMETGGIPGNAPAFSGPPGP